MLNNRKFSEPRDITLYPDTLNINKNNNHPSFVRGFRYDETNFPNDKTYSSQQQHSNLYFPQIQNYY